MNQRTLELHRSLHRIAHLVRCHPALSARATESAAFPLFEQELDDLDRAIAELNGEKSALARLRSGATQSAAELELHLSAVTAACQLAPDEHLANVNAPRNRGAATFAMEARGFAEAMREHERTLVAAGMHPDTLSHALALADLVIETAVRIRNAEARIAGLEHRITSGFAQARKRTRQLAIDLGPLLVGDTRVAWKHAASLGRSHRSNALGAAGAKLLVSGSSPAGAHVSVPANQNTSSPAANETPASAGRRLLKSIIAMFRGPQAGAARPDVTVEEIKRLPARSSS